jgi:hypothetical protein
MDKCKTTDKLGSQNAALFNEQLLMSNETKEDINSPVKLLECSKRGLCNYLGICKHNLE